MRVSDVIEQLRANLPSLPGPVTWNDRIVGAAEFAAVEDKARLPTPALYVLLGEERARVFNRTGTFEQEITEQIIIIAHLENTDRRGQGPQDLIEDLKVALFGALLNWVPDSDSYSVEFVSSRFEDMDRARYFHRFVFQIVKRLCYEDGVQLSLDNFDELFNDWELVETTPSEHPDAEDEITGLFTL